MYTSFARTSQMLKRTYLGFATLNTCTHMQAQKTLEHMLCARVFKSRATDCLESPLRGRNKSRTTESSKLHYAGFS